MSNIERMAAETVDIINSVLDQSERRGSIQRAVIAGTQVIVNGHYYPFTLGVDVNVNDGDYVLVQIMRDTRQAVIVGV